MIAADDRLGPWLLDLGLVSAAWLSLVMIAMMACRQPVRRRAVARAGILGALCLGPMSLLPSDRFDRIVPRPGLLEPMAPALRSAAVPLETLGRAAASLYLALVLVGLAWLLLGAWASRRLIRDARPASDWASVLYQGLLAAAPSGPRPALRVSHRLGRPALLGVLRPTIVIPEGWDRPGPGSAERLRITLLHELAHAARQDVAFLWLASLVQALWFLFPPAWWIRRQLLIDQEVLADHQAARRLGGIGASYAASLVELATLNSGRPGRSDPAPPRPRPTTDSNRSPLLLRIEMLLHCPFPVHQAAPRWWRIGLASVMTLLLLIASRFSLLDPPTPSTPAATRPEATAFRLIELDVEAGAGRDADPLRLPAPLPDAFELSALVLAAPGDLEQIVIAGYRLGLPTAPPVVPAGRDEAEAEADAWHRIRMRVEGQEVRLWVDDQPVSTGPEPGGSPDGWLTIRPPPGGSMRLRDLMLSPSEPTRPADGTA